MSRRDWTIGCAGALLMLACVALGQWLDREVVATMVAQQRIEAFRAGVGEGMARVGCWGGFKVDSATGLPVEPAGVPVREGGQ